MKHFRIVPLSKAYANKVREERKDEFGHEVIERVATGYGPCRVSLKLFKPGVDRKIITEPQSL